MPPIYAKFYDWCPRPALSCTWLDTWRGWGRLNPPFAMDGARAAFCQVYNLGAPNIVFIGSSHVYHLGETMHHQAWRCHLNPMAADFLVNSDYVGVGGLKWWTLEREIHGIFTSPRKLAKYGNQWAQYLNRNHFPEAAIIINGSNDADDFNNCTLSAVPGGIYDIDFYACATAIMEKWLAELKPVILQAIRHIIDILPHGTKLFYLPIIPRIWWHKNTRELANKLDHYITVTLKREHRININLLSIRSLIRYPAVSEYDNIYRDLLPSFLEEDNTHLNIWGYECVIRDVAPSVMAYKGSRQ